MLKITLPGGEYWDEVSQTFITTDPVELELEHSLLAISKWESKWKKPFLADNSKTDEETRDYIRCMCLNDDIDPLVFLRLDGETFKAITDYINDPHTATTINDRNKSAPNRDIITSELIYYWMTASSIPFECETWNLNRLMMLIRIASIKNNPDKKANKMSNREVMAENKRLNEARKAKLKSHG